MRWNPCALLLPLLLALAPLAAAAPAITNVSPADASFTHLKTVSATVTGTGTLTVTVSVNGSAPVTATAAEQTPTRFVANDVPFESSDPDVPLVVGNSMVTVSATDDDGTSEQTVTVTFDDAAPVLTAATIDPALGDPDATATTGFASVRFTGTMLDNDPQVFGRLVVAGITFIITLKDDGTYTSFRLPLEPGAAQFTVRAQDRAGNQTDQVFHITRLVACQDPNTVTSNAPVATYVVDRPDDLADPLPDDGICDVRPDLRGNDDPNRIVPPIKHCTLRAAIQTANHHAGEDKIRINVLGPIVLTRDGAREDDAESGDLDVTENLRIEGLGRDTTIIDARKLGDRVFDVAEGAHLQLLRLTLTGGRAPRATKTDAAEGGGCARSRGTLQVNSVAFLNCASDAPGGALAIEGTATDTALTCAIVARSMSKTDGGALAVDGAALTLRNSTLALNTALRRGGALSMIGDGDPLSLVLKNVTLSQNRAKTAGGALDLGASVSAAINNCTFANNVARTGTTLSTTDDGQAEISNSILGDVSKLACDPNSPEPVVSMGGNVDRGHSCIPTPSTGDQPDEDPKLDKLGSNPPKTSTGELPLPPTHSLLLGSPAIDHAGTGPVACEPLDARDVERGDFPHADNADGAATSTPRFCDAGALELFVDPPP